VNLFLFFAVLAMLGFGGWCIFTALVGISPKKEERTWERLTVFWVGRILLAFLAFDLILAASWGTMRLILYILAAN
jgi:hypothetical protein